MRATDAPSTVPAPASDVAADPTAIRPFEVHIPDAVLDDPEEGVPTVELERMRERQAFWGPEQDYSAIQGTKPQTLGYASNDSPAGQAAWIIDKVHVLCDCPGGHEDKFTKDELL